MLAENLNKNEAARVNRYLKHVFVPKKRVVEKTAEVPKEDHEAFKNVKLAESFDLLKYGQEEYQKGVAYELAKEELVKRAEIENLSTEQIANKVNDYVRINLNRLPDFYTKLGEIKFFDTPTLTAKFQRKFAEHALHAGLTPEKIESFLITAYNKSYASD